MAGVHTLDHSGSFIGPVDVSVAGGRVTGVGRGLHPARDQPRLGGHWLWLLPGIFDCLLHAGLASFDQLDLMRTPNSRRRIPTGHTPPIRPGAWMTIMRSARVASAL